MPLHMIIPVGSGTAVGSGITTYSGLVTSAGLWLDRSDLTTTIPDLITLTEERLNRILRTYKMEETTTITADAERVDMPTDCRKVRSIYLDTDPRAKLEMVTMAVLRTKYAQQITGQPEVFAISGDDIVLGPAPDAEYDLILTYYQEIPALSSDNETNWLISKHPSLYLYGVLLQAEFFGWNDERLPMIKSAWDEAIDELAEESKGMHYGAAPLRLRASVRE